MIKGFCKKHQNNEWLAIVMMYVSNRFLIVLKQWKFRRFQLIFDKIKLLTCFVQIKKIKHRILSFQLKKNSFCQMLTVDARHKNLHPSFDLTRILKPYQSVLGRNKSKCHDSLMPRGGRLRSCAIQNFMPHMVEWNVCFEKQCVNFIHIRNKNFTAMTSLLENSTSFKSIIVTIEFDKKRCLIFH